MILNCKYVIRRVELKFHFCRLLCMLLFTIICRKQLCIEHFANVLYTCSISFSWLFIIFCDNFDLVSNTKTKQSDSENTHVRKQISVVELVFGTFFILMIVRQESN